MKRNNIISVLILIIVIVGVWFASGYFVYINFENEKGTIGDLFSPINALFAGLAFCGIILTIYLQQKELSLQRQELVNTREIFHRQKFENTFFQLTNTQQKLTDAIHHEYAIITTTSGKEKRDEVKLDGRKLFWSLMLDLRAMHTFIMGLGKNSFRGETNMDTQMRRRFLEFHINPDFSYDAKGNYKNIDLKDDSQVAKFLFLKVSSSFAEVLSHYFKHLYKILEYINESEKHELELVTDPSMRSDTRKRFQNYADFLQAQLSDPELAMIYYHSFEHSTVFDLMRKYDFFRSLPPRSLISADHLSWSESKA